MTLNEYTPKALINSCKKIQDWIVESEMGLNAVRDQDGFFDEKELDKEDSFYPAFQRLDEVIEKLEEELEV